MTAGRMPAPDWRESSAYAWLLRAEPAAFAWEWLRRDPGYRRASAGRASCRAPPGSLTALPTDAAAARWGLHAFENPAHPAPIARPIWRRQRLPRVLVADATPLGPADDRLDLARFADLATLRRAADGTEHLLLSDGRASLRLDVMAGSLLTGPACLSYRLGGLAALRGPLDALGDLMRLCRSGRLAHVPAGNRNRRLVLLLRVSDALREGARQREIASVLLSDDAAAVRWRSEVPSLRSRAQRLAKGARDMTRGGYWALLRR